MRRSRLAILAALTACYDGGGLGSDAAVAPDARPDRGIVRVKVSGFVEKTGLRVFFQESDSSLSLSTRTDANGEATGRLGPDGFVTLVAGFEPALTLWTYAGVQPGDELEFFEPDAVNVETPVDSISIFANGAGDPPLTFRSSCGGAQTIFDPLPVALPVTICGPRGDFLLERGQVYRYARDVDMTATPLVMYFIGEYLDYGLSTVTVANAPGFDAFVTQALMGQGFPLEQTSNVGSISAGQLRVELGLPLPANGTVLTQVDFFEDPAAPHLVDWRPSAARFDLDFDAIPIAPASERPRYDPTTTSIVWSEGPGTPGDLVRATMQWRDSEQSRTRSWVIIGPRGDAPVLRVPRLPATDLQPSIEVPQSMESFVVGDQRDWLRTHMHGRWLAEGVTWPIHGEAGRVVWRSL
ncbi:MAG: hypothetical protein ACKV2T_39610 [Kofleriaceae bacterium]